MKLVCGCAGTRKRSQAVTWLCIQLQAAQKKGHFCMFGCSLTKVTFRVHNPAQQDQGQPSMHSSIMEFSETFIPPLRESVLACLQQV